MNRLILVALTWSLTVPQAPDVRAVTRELEQIEQQLAASWKDADCERWSALIAPEWSVTHITGAVIPKAQALQMCRSQETKIETFKIDDVAVRVFDEAAVVTGRTFVTTAGAKPESVTLRFTDVFVRRDGRWQVVASHATRLAD
jgi:hypothetical protein